MKNFIDNFLKDFLNKNKNLSIYFRKNHRTNFTLISLQELLFLNEFMNGLLYKSVDELLNKFLQKVVEELLDDFLDLDFFGSCMHLCKIMQESLEKFLINY